MRKFSVRPAITLRGRQFKGARGFAGKPFHPPLTDIPIGAYVIGAVLDIVSVIGGKHHGWSREVWHAATYVFIGGAIVSVFAALTGLFDWWRSTEPGTQARRTANTHALIMVCVTVAVLVNIVLRLNGYHTDAYTPVGIMIFSVVIVVLVGWGRDLRRQHGVRLRLQCRDRRRQSGLAPIRDRRHARREALTAMTIEMLDPYDEPR